MENIASRPAKVGDKLVTHNFGTGTIGFAGIEDKKVAVCLLPGTEVAFDEPIRSFDGIGADENRKVACFAQKNMETKSVHHDALEFPDGKFVFLSRLSTEQTATVLQMPAQQTIMHVDLPAESEVLAEVKELETIR